MNRITVEGGGAAAGLARATFARAGCAVAAAPGSGGRAPLLVTLNEPTLFLFADLFGAAASRSLLSSGMPLSRRVVAWSGGAPLRGPARLLLVPLARVAAVAAQAATSRPGDAPPMVVTCRGRAYNSGGPVGPRFAFVWNDVPAKPIDAGAGWTVAARGGWAFTAATGAGHSMVQAVVPEDDEARAAAVAVVALSIATVRHGFAPGRPADFRGDASPRLGAALAGRAFALGDEHLALDPLCGDGIGHALRAAVLLAALARARLFASGTGASIYERRMRAAFVAHLRNCETYYAHIAEAAAWRPAVREMRSRRRLEEAILASTDSPAYRLDGRTLSVSCGAPR